MVPEITSTSGADALSADAPSLNMKPSPELIGLTGRARSGKDTVAGMLEEHNTVITISFADPLRDALRAMLGLTHDHFFGSLKEEVIPWLGKSPRQLMQTLGTEWGRNTINDSIWLLLAEQKISKWLQAGAHVIVTDVRFDNEAELIHRLGGSVWHISRPGKHIEASSHPSEAGVSVFDASVDKAVFNDGTLEQLEAFVTELFKEGSGG